MLYKLEIENFYSIREPQIIDLRARQDIDSDRLVEVGADGKTRVPKVVALFGANASGKSNVLKAVSFISWFVSNSFLMGGPEAPLPYAYFADEESEKRPTRIAIEFTGPSDLKQIRKSDSESCRYAYELVLAGNRRYSAQMKHGPFPSRYDGTYARVASETLKYWPIGSKKPVVLFARDASDKVTGSDEHFALSDFRPLLENVLRSNASVISTLSQLKHPAATRLWREAARAVSNILVEKNPFPDMALMNWIMSNPNLLGALNNEIARVDFGIRELSLEKTPNGQVLVAHHNGLSSALPLSAESHGTRQFIWIFPLILQALQSGSLAIIDELDLSIHPNFLPELLRWFQSTKRNKLNAQLWTACQNPSLLEELSKEEIFFCEKDSRGRTSIYGLNDIEDVRRNDNFYRKYLSGVYGAVPHLG
jgi:uncharacterized protein